jgi:glucan endo-1,3-alpha-glucosidase
MYKSRAVVSTFMGESCTFGQASPSQGWKTQFVQHPDLLNKIYFIPFFSIDPRDFGNWPLDGFLPVRSGDATFSLG